MKLAISDVKELELKKDIEGLIIALEYKKDKEIQDLAAETLGKIGDLRATDPILHSLTKNPLEQSFFKDKVTGRRSLITNNIDFWRRALKKLFGDYTGLILKAFMYSSVLTEYSSEESDREEYEYDMDKSDEAIQDLCKISSQISNNILHKIRKKSSVKVLTNYYSTVAGKREDYDILSFESQHEIAKNELKQRGNPPYDPSAYLYKDAWKIK